MGQEILDGDGAVNKFHEVTCSKLTTVLVSGIKELVRFH